MYSNIRGMINAISTKCGQQFNTFEHTLYEKTSCTQIVVQKASIPYVFSDILWG